MKHTNVCHGILLGLLLACPAKPSAPPPGAFAEVELNDSDRLLELQDPASQSDGIQATPAVDQIPKAQRVRKHNIFKAMLKTTKRVLITTALVASAPVWLPLVISECVT